MKPTLALIAAALAAWGMADAALAQDVTPRRGPPPRMDAYAGRPAAPPAMVPPAPGRAAPGARAPAPGYPTPAYGPYGTSPQPRAPTYLGSDWRQQQDAARSGVRQGQMAPLGAVIGEIRRHDPGRQLDTGIEYQGGRAVYRVRWMDDRGRRTDYIVDAQTGAILSGR